MVGRTSAGRTIQRGEPQRGATLSEANAPREANLSGANLSEANLSEANLRGAVLASGPAGGSPSSSPASPRVSVPLSGDLVGYGSCGLVADGSLWSSALKHWDSESYEGPSEVVPWVRSRLALLDVAELKACSGGSR